MSYEKVMGMDFEEAIKEKHAFWSRIAKENGWSMKGRFITLWVDRWGNVKDSIYSSEGNTAHCIKSEGDRFLKWVKTG